MAIEPRTKLPEIIKQNQHQILEDWMRVQLAASTRRADLISDVELREESQEFMPLLVEGVSEGEISQITGPEWSGMREMLSRLSRDRANRGFTPSATATFVLSFKQPLFERLRDSVGLDGQALADELWLANVLLDKLALFTTEEYQRTRDSIIQRQHQELLELSTPVVKLWDGVLALPLIGTLDSARTQVVMESLLQKIVETGSSIAIIEITGVPTVDTLVAKHLMKTVAAARLMGADCIISGIRPQIAQTIVHLGVALSDVVTKATMADAVAVALKRSGYVITKSGN